MEMSVFGEEYDDMEFGVDTLHAIQYKLRIIDIPISGPTFIYGDKFWLSIIPQS